MELVLLLTGKTVDKPLLDLMATFEGRLQHYVRFKRIELADQKIKKPSAEQLLRAEAEGQLKEVQSSDFLVLLDEKGQSFNSRAFAVQLQKWMNAGHKRMVFLVGGAYGFHESVYQRAQAQLRLSDMTFNHQVVRLLFAEQLYRAFTILSNHPYHND